MKIAFVHQPWDYAEPGRAHGSLTVLTNALARQLESQHEIFVIGRRRPGQPREVEHNRARYCGVRARFGRAVTALTRRLGLHTPGRPDFSRVLYCLPYSLAVARTLRREGCDIAHVHNFSSLVPVIRRLNPHMKIVLHMHCEWLTQLDRDMIESRLRGVDAVVGCSGYITNKVRREFPLLADRCHTVRNGVDVQRFQPNGRAGLPNGPTRILFVGRVSPEKGVHTLLNAFEQIAQRRPNVTLQIVGPLVPAPREFIAQLCEPELAAALAPCYDSDYIGAVRRTAARLGAQRVEFAGPIRHDELPGLYRHADLVVNPSFSESFGMSLIEAMASGTPIVATRVGGMVEILADGRAGVLVPSGDQAALGKAIEHLLEDGELRAEMGSHGRELATSRYAWDHIAEELSSVYQSIC